MAFSTTPTLSLVEVWLPPFQEGKGSWCLGFVGNAIYSMMFDHKAIS